MGKQLFKFFFLFLFINNIPLSLFGQLRIYISPKGNDKSPGTKEKPVCTFREAQELARKSPADASVEVIFSKGTYYLPQTIKFTSADSKIPSLKVTYRAEEEGDVILSGGSLLHLKWKPVGDGIFAAEVCDNPAIDQLYINGKRQRMARFPNAVEGKNVFDTWDLSHNAKVDSTYDPLTPERIARWKNPEGGYIHAMHSALWGDMHWIIKGKNADGTLNYEGGWQNNRPSEMHPVYRMVENIFEELDAPGEWFFNTKEQKLYLIPETGTNIKNSKVEIVRLRHLIEFSGTKEDPVKSVNLEGFIFRHTARTIMENKEPLLRSDWTVYRGGAVVFTGTEDCSITGCEFDQVGGNAIFVNSYNRRITVRGCYIHHSGANGVAFVGDPVAVRSPLFRYSDQNFSLIERTPGPKGENFPEDCLVEDCLITMTGRYEKQTAPVQISMSHKIRVNHCTIYDVPRAGINISEGTFGGHIIENCDVFNTVLETGDHGSFNSWGRDRFWTPDINKTVPEVIKQPGLPFLDMLECNIIRGCRWRCDHGWDIDLDDGSTWYRIYNNVLLNGGLKMREGYNRIATNNVIVNNSLHPHVWYPNSGDVFMHNIVFGAYKPAVMARAIATDGKWGAQLDSNLFATNNEDRFRFAKNGCDGNSLVGDPRFVNAEDGDFRVKEGSPAFKVGFKNFPMNEYGVFSEKLKKMAKRPSIPVLITNQKANSGHTFQWYGATLKNVETLGEQSAAGLPEMCGIILLDVPANSALANFGLKVGDVFLRCQGQKIMNFEHFIQVIKDINKVHIEIQRNQTKETVILTTK